MGREVDLVEAAYSRLDRRNENPPDGQYLDLLRGHEDAVVGLAELIGVRPFQSAGGSNPHHLEPARVFSLQPPSEPVLESLTRRPVELDLDDGRLFFDHNTFPCEGGDTSRS